MAPCLNRLFQHTKVVQKLILIQSFVITIYFDSSYNYLVPQNIRSYIDSWDELGTKDFITTSVINTDPVVQPRQYVVKSNQLTPVIKKSQKINTQLFRAKINNGYKYLLQKIYFSKSSLQILPQQISPLTEIIAIKILIFADQLYGMYVCGYKIYSYHLFQKNNIIYIGQQLQPCCPKTAPSCSRNFQQTSA
eukprot:TRINITY_DN1747_c0_g1_i2.p2 TRINITY_DN1747_c0_g1~~TRINITY_DN1747_c0_g1_i2.p2  ORF type:complete len:192 (-),score=-13.66 TRINITY_DN1747_c0_g1_i2:976-1551(-)